MDAESWFSVTPERLAAHIAVRMCRARRGLLVVDPFCGCGGNVIQQALADPTGAVLAIDIDPTKASIDLHPLRHLPPLHPLRPLRPLCPLHPLHPLCCPQIAMARHNARLYGVEHRVLFALGDALGHPVR